MNYWSKKDKLSKQARTHYHAMETQYPADIESCVAHSRIFTQTAPFNAERLPFHSSIVLEEADTVTAIKKHSPKRVCALNFASHKQPGGMFMEGSSAQEESLCHASILYNVLSRLQPYYDENKTRLNRSLYTNRGLYTPDVLFVSDDKEYRADVITCAAPNKTAAQKYCAVSDEENSMVLRDRIDFMLGIAAQAQPEVLILGAYGCGVFGQNPIEVATAFKELLNGKYKDVFPMIVFAIPDMSGANYRSFRNVFLAK